MTAQIELETLFDYADGKLFWKLPRKKIRVGDEAGSVQNNGYRAVCLDRKKHQAHRLVWIMHYGPIPIGHSIDHIDGNKLNNDISNLRPAMYHENGQNSKKPITNTTGYKGVSFSKTAKKYEARIKSQGKQYLLGYFQTPEEAHAAYCKAAKDLNGAFARTE